MLADLNTKSHPQARLSSLRRMWSIEKINQEDQNEGEVSSEGETPKIQVKMIRIKSKDDQQQNKEELEEIGCQPASQPKQITN